MRSAEVAVHGISAGVLTEVQKGSAYRFRYHETYVGPPVSLTMPVERKAYEFDRMPAFFEGLLPEGYNLEALLRAHKLDRSDLFSQLIVIGGDTIGAVTIKGIG